MRDKPRSFLVRLRHFSRKERSRRRLTARLPKGGIGAEVGVWQADFSARLLRVTRPSRLHLIDPWLFVEGKGYKGTWYGGAIAENQADMDAIYEGVLERFSDEIQSEVVEVCRETSEAAAERFPPAYFDWVYIDGDHHYEVVRRDLELFGERMKPGGLLCGDDYRPGGSGWRGEGVSRAVDEYVAAGAATFMAIHDKQFLLRVHGELPN